MTSKFGRSGQIWKPNQKKLLSARKIEAECMRTISSEGIERQHAVAREL